MWETRVYELLALYCWPDSAVDLKLLHEIKFINFFLNSLKIQICYIFL